MQYSILVYVWQIEKRRKDCSLHAASCRRHKHQFQQQHDNDDGDFYGEPDTSPGSFCAAGQVVFVNLASLHTTQHLRPEHIAAAKSFTASLSSTSELNSLENVLKALKNNERQVPYRASKLTYALQSVLNQQSTINLLVHVNPILTGADTSAYYASIASSSSSSSAPSSSGSSGKDNTDGDIMGGSNGNGSCSDSSSPETYAAKRCVRTLSVSERIARHTSGVMWCRHSFGCAAVYYRYMLSCLLLLLLLLLLSQFFIMRW